MKSTTKSARPSGNEKRSAVFTATCESSPSRRPSARGPHARCARRRSRALGGRGPAGGARGGRLRRRAAALRPEPGAGACRLEDSRAGRRACAFPPPRATRRRRSARLRCETAAGTSSAATGRPPGGLQARCRRSCRLHPRRASRHAGCPARARRAPGGRRDDTTGAGVRAGRSEAQGPARTGRRGPPTCVGRRPPHSSRSGAPIASEHAADSPGK